MSIIGLIACEPCSRKKGNFITLGHDEDGDFKIPGERCDVIERLPNGLYRQRCGSLTAGFPLSNVEFITHPNGRVQRGDGLGALVHEPWEEA